MDVLKKYIDFSVISNKQGLRPIEVKFIFQKINGYLYFYV